jgi:hypothetical protein
MSSPRNNKKKGKSARIDGRKEGKEIEQGKGRKRCD